MTLSAVRQFALLLVVAVVSAAPAVAWAGDSAAPDGPLFTIEEAIDVAKRCVLERHIRVVGSFIESARFERNARGDRGPFWRVSWATSREIKGGQVIVSVFGDRSCEVTFGE